MGSGVNFRKAYNKSGRKDWNAFQKEYAEDRCV